MIEAGGGGSAPAQTLGRVLPLHGHESSSSSENGGKGGENPHPSPSPLLRSPAYVAAVAASEALEAAAAEHAKITAPEVAAAAAAAAAAVGAVVAWACRGCGTSAPRRWWQPRASRRTGVMDRTTTTRRGASSTPPTPAPPSSSRPRPWLLDLLLRRRLFVVVAGRSRSSRTRTVGGGPSAPAAAAFSSGLRPRALLSRPASVGAATMTRMAQHRHPQAQGYGGRRFSFIEFGCFGRGHLLAAQVAAHFPRSTVLAVHVCDSSSSSSSSSSTTTGLYKDTVRHAPDLSALVRIADEANLRNLHIANLNRASSQGVGTGSGAAASGYASLSSSSSSSSSSDGSSSSSSSSSSSVLDASFLAALKGLQRKGKLQCQFLALSDLSTLSRDLLPFELERLLAEALGLCAETFLPPALPDERFFSYWAGVEDLIGRTAERVRRQRVILGDVDAKLLGE